MNPFCFNHDKPVMMKAVERIIESGHDDFGNNKYGVRKCWECPSCKTRYHRGAEVIRRK